MKVYYIKYSFLTMNFLLSLFMTKFDTWNEEYSFKEESRLLWHITATLNRHVDQCKRVRPNSSVDLLLYFVPIFAEWNRGLRKWCLVYLYRSLGVLTLYVTFKDELSICVLKVDGWNIFNEGDSSITSYKFSFSSSVSRVCLLFIPSSDVSSLCWNWGVSVLVCLLLKLYAYPPLNIRPINEKKKKNRKITSNVIAEMT